MSFRSSEYLQRYKLVQFQLDDVIRMPANDQHQQKMVISLLLMIGLHSMIGTMLILRFNSS